LKTKDRFHHFPVTARILLIRLRSMGDCLLLTAPVRALKEAFPGFRVSVLVEPKFADCFSGNPDFSEVLLARGKYATAGRLLLRRFHAIINLHGGTTSLFYSCMAWGRRVGGEHYRGAFLYNGLVPPPDSAAHTVESTMAIFRWLGMQQEASPPLRFEKQAAAAGRIEETLKGRNYAVIHPGSVMATKRWEPSRFAEVARNLSNRGLTIVVTSGPGEEMYASEVARQIDASVIMLGLSIPELAELVRGAILYIGNDSGPMHLAAAVGTPTVAVWGSSDSRRWHPWGVDHRVVQNPFECNPCPGYRCLVADSPLCIESVTVEQVNTAVKELTGIETTKQTKDTKHT
jgi:lipopolysaccharide heptosyltransferase III